MPTSRSSAFIPVAAICANASDLAVIRSSSARGFSSWSCSNTRSGWQRRQIFLKQNCWRGFTRWSADWNSLTRANIPVGTWVEAHRLCKDIDEKDTVYVALTLQLDGQFWTQDEKLKT